uniref:Peptidase M13 C-terminal domain-containing protein n=1 Tax=Romanomermis culicivorax TaxID=13658 RepID=A0A915I6D4_ROMCU
MLGHQFDKNGVIRNWWSPSTEKNYEEQTQCFIKQYSNYVDPMTMQKIDGNRTLNTNIDHNSGIRIAMRAYNQYSKQRNETERLLPDLNLTQHQAFFTSFARRYCGANRRETLMELKEELEDQSPDEILVNGPEINEKNMRAIYMPEIRWTER